MENTESNVVAQFEELLTRSESLSKKELTQAVTDFVGKIADYGLDLRRFAAKAAKNKEFWSALGTTLSPLVFEELSKEGRKEFMVEGVRMSMSVSTKYDYTNDPSWVKIQSQIDDLKEQQKGIEALLKARNKMGIEIDPETGETYEVGFATKSSTDIIRMSW